MREIPEELLTPVTTKNGVTKSVTQRIVAHSRVITRAVTHVPPLTIKLHLRYLSPKMKISHKSYLQQGVFSPTEGVWAGYELKAMHFRVESSCYGVETEVTTPISGP